MGKAEGLIQPPKVLQMKDTNDVVVIMIYHDISWHECAPQSRNAQGRRQARETLRTHRCNEGAGGANLGGVGPGLTRRGGTQEKAAEAPQQASVTIFGVESHFRRACGG